VLASTALRAPSAEAIAHALIETLFGGDAPEPSIPADGIADGALNERGERHRVYLPVHAQES
jgi:hypothetical protein